MSHSNEIYRIIILGGGIIGLTTACTLLKEYSTNKNLELIIISEKFSPETTADISAGYWQPYGLENLDERTLRWAAYTHDIFLSEFFSTKAARAGVMKVSAYVLQGFNHENKDNNDVIVKPPYSHLVRHFRLLDKHEIEMFNHLKPKSGHVLSSIVVEMRKYLPELQRFLQEDYRVKFIEMKIHSINQLKNKANLIINCTGLSSKYLFNDQTIRPARGQLIRVHAPWIKSAYVFDTDEGMAYIIPQSDSVVLGGTFQLNDWNTKADDIDTERILRTCAKCLPSLAQIRNGKVQAGLRPYRDGGIRLEHEKTSDGMDIVHCYGHSGSGVTLSWGCAKDVVEIVKEFLPPNPKEKNDLPEHEQLWRLVPNFEYVLLKAKI